MKTFYVQINYLELGSYKIEASYHTVPEEMTREEFKGLLTRSFSEEFHRLRKDVTRLLNVSVY